MAKIGPETIRAIPGYPRRLDKAGARAYFCKEHWPITERRAERLFATVPRIYIGRTALFETAALADLAEGLIAQAPSIADNVPVPNKRKRPAPKV